MLTRKLSLAIIPAFLLLGCPAEKKKTPPKTDKTAQPATKPAAKPADKPADKPEDKKDDTAAAAAAGEGTGSIKGVVSFKGKPPAPEKIDMKKDPKCVELNKGGKRPVAVVNDGKLADVFVRVTTAPDEKWDTREDEIMLDQQGCTYKPRMIGIQVDQTLKVKNSDPTLHNVHAYAKRSEFNMAMPKQGMTMDKDFKKEDLKARIACEVHPWMEAQLRIVEHPFFATTGEDGSFTIENVPAGKHTIEFEHAKFGKKTAEVEVTKDGTADANVEFAAKG